MASTTTNLGLTKPAYTESADVAVINENSDKIDTEAGKTRANLAAEYNASAAYSIGDYCSYNGVLYRCTTAIGSGGETWNSGHWTQVAVTGEIPKIVDNLTTNDATKALSAKQGKALNDKLTNVAYSTSGISYTNASYSDGGYVKVGNIVIVNIRITATANTNASITGFPSYRGKTTNQKNMVAVAVYSSDNELPSGCCAVAKAGQSSCEITLYKTVSGKEYSLSCVYICD